ncbi:MAG TPA: hypothetical protein VGC45_10390 [Gryllotalpicola sp.]
MALAVGASLALGVPLAASAAPVSTASVSSAAPASTLSFGFPSKGHQKPAPPKHHKPAPPKHHQPHPTKPAYPPTKPPKPPKPPWFPPPFYWGGWWWFPFYFPAHTFAPGSIVHCFITGYGGFSFYGTFTADESGSISLGTAAADGSLSAQLKAHGADLAGKTLNATLTDSTGKTVTQTVTVPTTATKGAATAATSSVTAADPGSLASTGTYISLATVWGAVGLVALGAAFVTMRSVVRRKDRAKA